MADARTHIEARGYQVTFTVTLADADKAAKTMAIIADCIADNGPEWLRVTFKNITLGTHSGTPRAKQAQGRTNVAHRVIGQG